MFWIVARIANTCRIFRGIVNGPMNGEASVAEPRASVAPNMEMSNMSRKTVQAFLIVNTIFSACVFVFVAYNVAAWDSTFALRNIDRLEAATVREIRSSVQGLFFLILIPLTVSSAIWLTLAWWMFATSDSKSH